MKKKKQKDADGEYEYEMVDIKPCSDKERNPPVPRCENTEYGYAQKSEECFGNYR